MHFKSILNNFNSLILNRKLWYNIQHNITSQLARLGVSVTKKNFYTKSVPHMLSIQQFLNPPKYTYFLSK
jgi:hypothetical protein